MIYYFAPMTSDEPVGGLQTICDHVEMLNEVAGFNIAAVISDNPSLKKWFHTKASVAATKDISVTKDDTVVIAEMTPEEVQHFKGAGRKLIAGLNWSLVKQFVTKEIIEKYGYEGIIANSRYSFDLLSKEYPHLKMYYVPNFIDSSLFKPIPGLPREDSSILMFPRKNIDHIGDIVKFVRWKGYKTKITLIDRFHKSDLPRIYSSHDIFIALGYPEGFARPPIEALLCGCVVVGFTGGGSTDYLVDGVNSLTAPDGDIDTLLSKLKLILDNSEFREYLRNNGRASVLKFNRENSKKFLLQVFPTEFCNIHIENSRSEEVLFHIGERQSPRIEEGEIDQERLCRYPVEKEFEKNGRAQDSACGEGDGSFLISQEAVPSNISAQQRKAHLAYLENVIIEKDVKIKHLNDTIDHIYVSHGWRILLTYYKLRDKIFPINTKRRFLAKAIFRAILELGKVFKNLDRASLKKFFYYFSTAGPEALEKKIEKKVSEGHIMAGIIRTNSIRLEASTVCQLKCPSCPNAAGEIHKNIGAGFLKFEDFKKIIGDNIWIRDVELSNWGEIFLNPDLLRIIKYAHKKNVVLRADCGVNLNTVSDEVLEALVKYRFNSMTCSIDGASQEIYSIYRRNGNFEKVIEHIKRINHYKSKYKSEFPLLTWQFVAFGHNTHEIKTARKMANDLKMRFFLKLSWDDLYTQTFSPVKDKDLVSKESGLGVSSREEYLEKTGKDYIEDSCTLLWNQSQINFDGRVLGCAINYRGDFGNAFTDGLIECLNNEKIGYARQMLLGVKESRDDIPCTVCKLYESKKKRSAWIKDMAAGSKSSSSLTSQGYPLRLPLPAAEENGWKLYPLFNGATASMPNLSCHVSVLNPNRCPHLPHTHEEEEILLLLGGDVDLILPDRQEPHVNQRIRLKPGEFVYYPAYFAHTLQATSETSASYLMFKWQDHWTKNESPLAFCHFNLFDSINASEIKAGFCPRLVFEGPTVYLEKLHCHTSTLAPGAGYDPHIDGYDVAIIVLEGEVETLGKHVGPHSVIFYRAGEPHSMRNSGESIAKYVVFEFHGGHGKRR